MDDLQSLDLVWKSIAVTGALQFNMAVTKQLISTDGLLGEPMYVSTVSTQLCQRVKPEKC